MNKRIGYFFDRIEARMIECPVIKKYDLVRREVSYEDGKLRIRAELSDGGAFECFLYVLEMAGQIQMEKYSYHWQDASGNLIMRWDNAPHYPDLPFYPHHQHIGLDHVEGTPMPPDLLSFIDNIEKKWSDSTGRKA